MGYEQCEAKFPCRCGAGHLVAEWEEHDTYPSSNKHYSWHFDCPACATAYTVYGEFIPAIVRSEDAEEHRRMVAAYSASRDKCGAYAIEKYLTKWQDYVRRLRSKAAMHRVIGGGSYSTFLKRSGADLAREIKDALGWKPVKCLRHMQMEDEELNRLHDETERLWNEKEEHWKTIEKHALPLG